MCKRGAYGSTEVPQWGPRARDKVPQKLKLSVNECLNFDILEEKLIKRQKIPSSKIRVG